MQDVDKLRPFSVQCSMRKVHSYGSRYDRPSATLMWRLADLCWGCAVYLYMNQNLFTRRRVGRRICVQCKNAFTSTQVGDVLVTSVKRTQESADRVHVGYSGRGGGGRSVVVGCESNSSKRCDNRLQH